MFTAQILFNILNPNPVSHYQILSLHYKNMLTSGWIRVNPALMLPPFSWWRHRLEAFSALLALCAGKTPVSGELPAQRPVARGFDAFFGLCLIKQLSKHSRGWWFETLSRPLWRHCNDSTSFNTTANVSHPSDILFAGNDFLPTNRSFKNLDHSKMGFLFMKFWNFV